MLLNFDDDLGKRHFEFCFTGFVLGGSLQQQKGMTVLRREVAIFEKLESISEMKPCGKKLPNGEPDRQLKNGDGSKQQLHLDVTEYDLLYSYLAQVPWQSGTPVKHAVETIDWLDRAQRQSLT
jgi:hypothetical protein